MPEREDFKAALLTEFNEAQRRGAGAVEVQSGELHRKVGGYPSTNHRMPVCCGVMRSEMHGDDEILSQPPKGKGATLKIRYHLPR